MTLRVCFIIIASVICGILPAQDVTGRWAGVADTTDEATTEFDALIWPHLMV
jgi:hypothetical protein